MRDINVYTETPVHQLPAALEYYSTLPKKDPVGDLEPHPKAEPLPEESNIDLQRKSTRKTNRLRQNLVQTYQNGSCTALPQFNIELGFNIELVKIHPYQSGANLTERYNRTLREKLRVIMTYHNVHPNQWKTIISFVNLAINNCPQNKSKLTPSQKFLGRDTDTILPRQQTSEVTDNLPGSGTLVDQIVRCKHAGETILWQSDTRKIGDLVYLKTRNIRVPFCKQFLRFRGPFVIVKETKSGYIIKEYRTSLFPGTGRDKEKLIKVDKDDEKPTSAAHIFPKEFFREFVAAWRGKLSQYHDDEDDEN